MKWLESVLQVAILYLVYEIGVWIQSTLDLFIPGSVIGLILLFMLLMTKMYPLKWIENGSKFMNKHLVLFFIPATVGIMNHYRLFAGKGIFLIGIVIASTVCVMGASGFVSQQLAKKGEKRHG
ncbi:MAG TPA: CidA/LrgA family holin-like protein [Pseudogracilibacillus sp.]|nr:CidA/LrgA family holin-like protein [Pseudogracilibacillus sp.]